MTTDLALLPSPNTEEPQTPEPEETEYATAKPPQKTTAKPKQRNRNPTENIAELKQIMNDVVQIREIRQHLQNLSHDLTGNLTTMLQLVSADNLQFTTWNKTVTLYPNGFLLTQDQNGTRHSQHLNDLNPTQLHQLLQNLIPNIHNHLTKTRKNQKNLANELEKIHETLTENL